MSSPRTEQIANCEMSDFPQPIVRRVSYGPEFMGELLEERSTPEEKEALVTQLLQYPTVYVIRSKRLLKYGQRYRVYVGETNDIRKRTRQHLTQDPVNREDWAEFLQHDDVEMYVIGHEYFNKSLTLDIENRFLHYLESCKSVERRNNRRTNEQRSYYTVEHLDPLFDAVWKQLHEEEPELFEPQEEIVSSAIYKASPFQKLNEQQLEAQNNIFAAIDAALADPEGGHRLILVSGEAGSGKTVLISSIFNGIMMGVEEEDERFRYLIADPDNRGTGIDGYLVSGHKNEGGQLKVYEEIVRKSGMPSSRKGERRSRVYSPTSFVNQFSEDDPADVVLIDEAHLLLTQRSQGYTENIPQIEAILNRAKIVIAVFDPKQTLETPQHWETPIEEYFADRLAQPPIPLTNQMRLQADEDTLSWIRSVIDEGVIRPIHRDRRGYDLKIFDNPRTLEDAIREKDSAVENSLSRLLATYDWAYSAQKQNEGESDGRWYVDFMYAGQPFKRLWNLQVQEKDRERRLAYSKAWSERPITIDEVGSTYTIQGFDLNYAGVILGPSVTYRDGRIAIDPSKSAHGKARQRRTLADGSKASFGEQLINNELNVLLTRGTKGLYIYAVDHELRKALLDAQEHAM
ncbi:DNA/RNA helicase domain-containing protein [Corynebacterium sp. UBA2622]|uniref:DNA/RNA helicase domain-containing protein n=1 Tax=Corynebacterium sp. UBA2622 TaxID=1946393 RepID=UPI0025B9D37E|nr:DNA/RNA helicase domain-containing protein [Corynebacterium sp. UBA2622]